MLKFCESVYNRGCHNVGPWFLYQGLYFIEKKGWVSMNLYD